MVKQARNIPKARRRVPYGLWDDIKIEYNATYTKNLDTPYLRALHAKRNPQVMAIVAMMIERYDAKKAAEAIEVEQYEKRINKNMGVAQ